MKVQLRIADCTAVGDNYDVPLDSVVMGNPSPVIEAISLMDGVLIISLGCNFHAELSNVGSLIIYGTD